MKIFRGDAAAHSVNLGPPHITESIIARKLKFYTHSDRSSTLFRNANFFARGRVGAQRIPE